MPAPTESLRNRPPRLPAHVWGEIGTACYERNLAALRAAQPMVADSVDATVIPSGVAEAAGRDGTRAVQLMDESGRRVWLGGSSMPGVSASEMFSDLSQDAGNVSLPGILTGIEPLVITERLARHCAVFVVEENPLFLKLAMHLHDYSAHLAGGRLVVLLGDDLEARCVEFFEHQPGYTLPTQMFSVPQRSPAQIADLRRRFEQAGEKASKVQARVAASCGESIRCRPLERLTDNPRLALLGVDAGEDGLGHARRIRRALDALGWKYEVCVPDSPAKCHMAARMQTIERAWAEWVLFLDGFPAPLRALLPAELPIAAWYRPGAGGAPPPSAVGPCDLLLASTRSQYDAFISGGLPRDWVAFSEPAADAKPGSGSTPPPGVGPAPIAVLADLPDDRPEACGIGLPSHMALWRALQEATGRCVDRYADESAEDILLVAERASGTVLKEPLSRKQFVDSIRMSVAPAVLGRADVDTLLSSGHEVAVWGQNWPAMDAGADLRRGTIPDGEALHRIATAASAVVLPWKSPRAVELALDALAAGVPVLLRASRDYLLHEYPGLSSIADFLGFYQTRSGLIESLRRLETQGEQRLDHAEAAVAEIRTNHTVANRLLAVVHRLRQRTGQRGARAP